MIPHLYLYMTSTLCVLISMCMRVQYIVCLLYCDISAVADIFLEAVQLPSKSGTDQSGVMCVCVHACRREPACVCELEMCVCVCVCVGIGGGGGGGVVKVPYLQATGSF